MKKLVCALALVICIGCSTTPHLSQEPKPVPAELSSMREQVYNAYFGGDTNALRELEGEDFVVIGSTGKPETTEGRYDSIGRQKAAGTWFPRGVQRQEEFSSARIYGNTAIVHGRDVYGADRSPVITTEVWLKRNGQWKLVHLHFHSPS